MVNKVLLYFISEFSYLSNELPGLIKKMDYQLDRKMFFERMSLKEDKFRQLYNSLLKIFKKYGKKDVTKPEKSSWK